MDLKFVPFDPSAAVHIYWRNLPHWRQEGATYFVTFRLADSIPSSTARLWKAERSAWLMKWGITDEMQEEERRRAYLTIPGRERRRFERSEARRFLKELDKCHGSCEFRDPKKRAKLVEALHFHDERARCGDYVVMPNHAHWLVLPAPTTKLEDTLKSVKRYSAGEINRITGRTGRLWQKESFDRIVRDPDELAWYRAYIENNPAVARLKQDEYTYHRADWLDDSPA